MELKSCPFCGKMPRVFYNKNLNYNMCECLSCYGLLMSEKLWNTRPDTWTTITDDPASLPKIYEAVHVCQRDSDGDLNYLDAHIREDGLWITEDGYFVQSVIAWQPIQPYGGA